MILITPDFAPLTNPNWICVFEVLSILYNQNIVHAMDQDEMTHELSFIIIEAIFHHLIARNKYYFNVHTIIDQQINKTSLDELRLVDTAMYIMEIKKINDISDQGCIMIRWIDLYPHDSIGDNSDFQLLCSSLHICMVDWCDEEYNFWPTAISLSPGEKT